MDLHRLTRVRPRLRSIPSAASTTRVICSPVKSALPAVTLSHVVWWGWSQRETAGSGLYIIDVPVGKNLRGFRDKPAASAAATAMTG